MKKYTNNWITALDVAADKSWVRLRFETVRGNDNEIVELNVEMWELNKKGVYELYYVESGDEYSEAFARLLHEQQQELVMAAMEQEDEPYFFVA